MSFSADRDAATEASRWPGLLSDHANLVSWLHTNRNTEDLVLSNAGSCQSLPGFLYGLCERLTQWTHRD